MRARPGDWWQRHDRRRHLPAAGAAGRYVYVHAHRGLARARRSRGDIVAAAGGGERGGVRRHRPGGNGGGVAKILADGPIQILVNNAGIHDDAVMPGMRREQWASVIDVSLNGFFNVTQPLLMPMIRTRWGRIVNISSVAAIAGNRGQTNYAAAKAGLHGATRALALELASRGITVNAVAPGIIASPMSDAAFNAEQNRPHGADEARGYAPRRSPNWCSSWHRSRRVIFPVRSFRSTAG